MGIALENVYGRKGALGLNFYGHSIFLMEAFCVNLFLGPCITRKDNGTTGTVKNKVQGGIQG